MNLLIRGGLYQREKKIFSCGSEELTAGWTYTGG